MKPGAELQFTRGYWAFVPRDAAKYFQNSIMNGRKFQNLCLLIDVYNTFIYFICLSIDDFIRRTVLNILLLLCVTAVQIPGATSP